MFEMEKRPFASVVAVAIAEAGTAQGETVDAGV
jgi:hypothetical protein